MTPDVRQLLEEWARLGKAKEDGGLAIWPHLLKLRDRTEALLAVQAALRTPEFDQEDGAAND